MRLVYTADLHGDIAAYRSLLELAVRTEAQAVIVGGDLLPNAINRWNALELQRKFIANVLRPLLESFRAEHPGIAVFLLPGNDDWAAAITALDDLEAAGLAYTSWSGAIRSVEADEVAALPSIADGLAALAQQSDPARTIYVCHTPPADTPLDEMPHQKHVGSRALRAFIERHAPPLTLHGHIHEAPELSGQYAARIGSTWSINPGHDRRLFQAVALDTTDIAGTLEHTVFGRPAAAG